LRSGQLLDSLPLAQVLTGQAADLGNVAHGDVADRRPELADTVARQPVEDTRSLAARAHQARTRQQTQMLRCVRDALRNLSGDLLDRALALRQQVDYLRSSTATERLCHRRERIEERDLRFRSCHIFKLSLEYLQVKC